jgi:tRNA threonylcarbamoyladenosine biosynthesis protein TsaE
MQPMDTALDYQLEWHSQNPEHTDWLARQLGKQLQTGDLLCLQGDLGAGKTTFVRGLTRGWGSDDPVSSPTFILINEYRRQDGGRLYHLDTYRLESALEAEILGLDDLLLDGVLVIEWPEKILAVLPEERLWIEIGYLKAETERVLRFRAKGPRATALLDALRSSI